MEESKMVFYTSVPAFIEEIPRIPPEELKRMIDSGQPVVILDCNPEAVFRSEHIPGATPPCCFMGGTLWSDKWHTFERNGGTLSPE
jgi:hypothetical protein